MQISDVCKNYFSGFQGIFNFRKNDNTTNTLAMLKTLSYVTVVILGFAAAYGAASLFGRVSKKQHLSFPEKKMKDQAIKIILKKSMLTSNSTPIAITPFLEKAKSYAEKALHGESGELITYITKTLNSSEFQADPEKYMKVWEQRRGKTEEFAIVEDKAFLFFKTEVLPNLPLISKVQVDMEKLKAKAQTFVEGLNQPEELLSYIQDVVLADPAFQQDPQLFMKTWKEARGHSEEFRPVEDFARMFFDQEFQNLIGFF